MYLAVRQRSESIYIVLPIATAAESDKSHLSRKLPEGRGQSFIFAC